MKKYLLLVALVTLMACKKEYHCSVTKDGISEDLHCEKCSKSEVEAFQKSLVEDGYDFVNCHSE